MEKTIFAFARCSFRVVPLTKLPPPSSLRLAPLHLLYASWFSPSIFFFCCPARSAFVAVTISFFFMSCCCIWPIQLWTWLLTLQPPAFMTFNQPRVLPFTYCGFLYDLFEPVGFWTLLSYLVLCWTLVSPQILSNLRFRPEFYCRP